MARNRNYYMTSPWITRINFMYSISSSDKASRFSNDRYVIRYPKNSKIIRIDCIERKISHYLRRLPKHLVKGDFTMYAEKLNIPVKSSHALVHLKSLYLFKFLRNSKFLKKLEITELFPYKYDKPIFKKLFSHLMYLKSLSIQIGDFREVINLICFAKNLTRLEELNIHHHNCFSATQDRNLFTNMLENIKNINIKRLNLDIYFVLLELVSEKDLLPILNFKNLCKLDLSIRANENFFSTINGELSLLWEKIEVLAIGNQIFSHIQLEERNKEFRDYKFIITLILNDVPVKLEWIHFFKNLKRFEYISSLGNLGFISIPNSISNLSKLDSIFISSKNPKFCFSSKSNTLKKIQTLTWQKVSLKLDLKNYDKFLDNLKNFTKFAPFLSCVEIEFYAPKLKDISHFYEIVNQIERIHEVSLSIIEPTYDKNKVDWQKLKSFNFKFSNFNLKYSSQEFSIDFAKFLLGANQELKNLSFNFKYSVPIFENNVPIKIRDMIKSLGFRSFENLELGILKFTKADFQYFDSICEVVKMNNVKNLRIRIENFQFTNFQIREIQTLVNYSSNLETVSFIENHEEFDFLFFNNHKIKSLSEGKD